jgi:hypothetical protein
MTINGIFPHQEVSTDEIIAVTKNFSAATTETFIKSLHDEEDPERKKLLIATIMTGDEDITEELLALAPHCPEETAPYGHNLHHLIAIIRGLHEYEQYKYAPLCVARDTELSKITALMNMTSLLLKLQDFDNLPLIIENVDDYKTSKIWLTPEAAHVVLKYHEDVPYLINFLAVSPLEILQGLKYLNWYKQQSISTITDGTTDTFFDYLFVTATIEKHSYDDITTVGEDVIQAQHLSNPELEQFIEQHPEELEEYMAYVRERGITNIGGYHEYKNNGTILRDGAI